MNQQPVALTPELITAIVAGLVILLPILATQIILIIQAIRGQAIQVQQAETAKNAAIEVKAALAVQDERMDSKLNEIHNQTNSNLDDIKAQLAASQEARNVESPKNDNVA